jgi:hypothetical protein
MKLLTCPHCGEPGISVTRKLALGPAIPARCRSCGQRIGVPYIAAFAASLPFFVAIPFAFIQSSLATGALIWIGGAVVMGYLYWRFVPLIRR